MTRWPLKVKIHQECKWILCGISNFPAAFKKKNTYDDKRPQFIHIDW